MKLTDTKIETAGYTQIEGLEGCCHKSAQTYLAYASRGQIHGLG